MNLSTTIAKLRVLANSTSEMLSEWQQEELDEAIGELAAIDNARNLCTLCTSQSAQNCSSCGQRFCRAHASDSIFHCENAHWHSLDNGEAYCTRNCCSLCGFHCETHAHHWCAECVEHRRGLSDCAGCGALFCRNDVVQCYTCGRAICFECDKYFDGDISDASSDSDTKYWCAACAPEQANSNGSARK